jgi:hypothetical protein
LSAQDVISKYRSKELFKAAKHSLQFKLFIAKPIQNLTYIRFISSEQKIKFEDHLRELWTVDCRLLAIIRSS